LLRDAVEQRQVFGPLGDVHRARRRLLARHVLPPGVVLARTRGGRRRGRCRRRRRGLRGLLVGGGAAGGGSVGPPACPRVSLAWRSASCFSSSATRSASLDLPLVLAPPRPSSTSARSCSTSFWTACSCRRCSWIMLRSWRF